MPSEQTTGADLYPAVRRVAGLSATRDILSRSTPDSFPETLARLLPSLLPGAPAWLSELAQVERAVHAAKRWGRTGDLPNPRDVQEAIINPGLQALDVSWKNLCALRRELLDGAAEYREPERGRELLLVWPMRSGEAVMRPAGDDDLLALKIIGERLSTSHVARETGAPEAGLVRLLARAHQDGLIIKPPSRIARAQSTHPRPARDDVSFPGNAFHSRSFALQWHITQRCDLNCKHCYDRSPRADVTLEKGHHVLDQMARFCTERDVVGQVSFSGGNPLLHKHFFDFYSRAMDLGLNTAILGNPCSADILDRLCGIAPPVFYQVSLEGLEEHNNDIRGDGHFRRTLNFLALLRERGILAQVMLTLTEANQEQVVSLGEALAGLADSFTFNRLAPVGQGAALACAPVDTYPVFLRRYLEAARRQPHMEFKDSLFNTLFHDEGMPCFGGCTGSGCGAAYNFIAVLGDGAAHACRKMDSPIGNVHESGLAAVYDGEAAQRYRDGCSACDGCALRPGCGGCLAVAKGMGLDPLIERDPYCPFALGEEPAASSP